MNTHIPKPSFSTHSTPSWYRQAAKGRFLCLPMAALQDRRLTQQSLRMLMALALHANESGHCFPSRPLISQLTGIHPSNVSKATRKLEKLGWLTKQQRKGKSNLYQLRTPSIEPAMREETDLDAFLRCHGC